MSAKKTTKTSKNAKAKATAPRTKVHANKPSRRAAKAAPGGKRLSALDAAAQVLKAIGKPMRAQELIAAMAEKGLWRTPQGKTPHATLYSAMVREINTKGREARFVKTDRGLFTLNR